MAFVGRFRFKGRVPVVRAYVHSAGFEDWGFTAAREYLTSSLDFYERHHGGWIHDLAQYAFIIAATWGDNNKSKVADFFGYKHVKEWPGNPEVRSWVMRDGIYVESGATTCEDTILLLAREAEHRRSTRGLLDYITRNPEIPGSLGRLVIDSD